MKSKFPMALMAACVVLGTLLVAGCAKKSTGANAASTEKKTTLRFSTVVPKSELDADKTPIAVGINTWIKTVEQKSNGSISVSLFPGGQIAGSVNQTVTGIQSGAFEVSNFATGNWATYSNAFAELNVPYLFPDYATAHRVLDSDIGTNMIKKLEHDVPGIKGLAYIDIGFRQITNSRRVIKTPADLRGIKIRTMNDKLQIAAMKALGANVTPMPIAELYGALQQHVVDAQENPLSTIYNNKFYEVQKYCTLTNHSFTTTLLFMSKKAYDSLSKNQKQAVADADAASVAKSREAVAKADAEYEKLLTAAGMEIYKPTPAQLKLFRDAATTTWGEARAIMGDKRYNHLMDVVNSNG